MFTFFKKEVHYLGVDIGRTSVKIVEMKRIKGKPTLVNYGYSEDQSDFSNKNLQLDVAKSAALIQQICEKTGIKSMNAIAALPSFSVFSSVLSISGSNKQNLQEAVMWEAKKVVPLDLEEMVLDWKIIDNAADISPAPAAKDKNIQILLTGAPKALVKKYISIFKEAKMNLLSLETEIFSLTRSLIGLDKETIALVDLGAVNTDISVISRGLPMFSRSLDAGGIMLTQKISDSLKVNFKRAEQFKLDLSSSLSGDPASSWPENFQQTFTPIVNEIKYSLDLFQQKNGQKIEKVILSGGGANLPNIDSYLGKVLNMKVIVGDPWSRVAYPLDLKPVLDEIGSKMAIAAGLALRETI